MSKFTNRVVGTALAVTALNAIIAVPAMCSKKKRYKLAFGAFALAELALGIVLIAVKPKAKIPFFAGREDDFLTDEEIETIKASVRERSDHEHEQEEEEA